MFIRSNLPSGLFSMDWLCACFDIADESDLPASQDARTFLIGA